MAEVERQIKENLEIYKRSTAELKRAESEDVPITDSDVDNLFSDDYDSSRDVSIANIVIWLGIGGLWWKAIGLW